MRLKEDGECNSRLWGGRGSEGKGKSGSVTRSKKRVRIDMVFLIGYSAEIVLYVNRYCKKGIGKYGRYLYLDVVALPMRWRKSSTVHG